MSIIDLTAENFEQEVLKADKPVIVKLYFASGCMWCDKMAPLFEVYAKKHPEIKFAQYTPGKFGTPPKPGFEQSLIDKYKVSTFPTFLSFNNGELVRHILRDEIIKELNWEFPVNAPNGVPIFELSTSELKRLSVDLCEMVKAAKKELKARSERNSPNVVDPAEGTLDCDGCA